MNATDTHKLFICKYRHGPLNRLHAIKTSFIISVRASGWTGARPFHFRFRSYGGKSGASTPMIDTWKSQMSSHSTTRLPFTTCVFPIHIIEHAACFRSRCDNRADLWIALISFVALFHELHFNVSDSNE